VQSQNEPLKLESIKFGNRKKGSTTFLFKDTPVDLAKREAEFITKDLSESDASSFAEKSKKSKKSRKSSSELNVNSRETPVKKDSQESMKNVQPGLGS